MTTPTNPTEVKPEQLSLEGLSYQMLNIAMARRVFLLLTRAHFSNPDHYGHLSVPLAECRWTNDPKTCTLPVEYDYNYDPKQMERRPAIFVGCGDMVMQRKVLDNSARVTADGRGEEFASVGSYPVIIRHIGKTPDESLLLADLTFQFYLGIRKLLKEKAQLQSFEVMRVGTTRPFERTAEKTDATFMADLTLKVETNMTWLSVRESHVIKSTSFRLIDQQFSSGV